MPTMWDKRAEDVANKVVEAVKHEAAVVEEHNTPVVNDALAQAEKVAAEVTAKAHVEAHVAADKIDLHAAGLFGGIAQSLKDFAAKLRSGEETLTEEVKAELKKIGVEL